MAKGNINVQAENIFPIIKQFLYSDQEIFLRELVSNAVDACRKLQALSSIGEAKGDLGEPLVEVITDKEEKTLTIRDNGLGMTGEKLKNILRKSLFRERRSLFRSTKIKQMESLGILVWDSFLHLWFRIK